MKKIELFENANGNYLGNSTSYYKNRKNKKTYYQQNCVIYKRNDNEWFHLFTLYNTKMHSIKPSRTPEEAINKLNIKLKELNIKVKMERI